MSAKQNPPDLSLAFDVGHSSIGWAVLQTNSDVEIKGCGAVIFRADDCLASTRRGYRRQRRHIRSTRQRIKRMKALLLHLGVLTQAQLDKPGCAWPWKLAARVLAGGKTLTWPELWDALRWYAHNRGYDGNRRWSHAADDFDELDEAALSQLANDASLTEDEKDDAKKVKEAKRLMRETHTATMAETFCKVLNVDPLGAKNSSNVRFKGLNAAFPRRTVEREVRRILQAHFGKLPGVNEDFARALSGRDANDKDAWKAISWFSKPLPQRYYGGLLFGQLVPRFDNRIISTCPVTFAQKYEEFRAKGVNHEKANRLARAAAKVPSRNTLEFLNFRWGMLLANVRVARLADRELKPLTVEERKELDKRMREAGGMTESEFKKAVRDVSGAIRDDLARMFMEVNQEEALVLDPVQDCLTTEPVKTLFAALPLRIQKRARGQLRRGKSFTFASLYEAAKQAGESVAAFDAAVQQLLDKAAGKGRKKDKPLTRDELLAKSLSVRKLSGRAAYARPILAKAFAEVMAGKHPKEEDGCLFVTEKMREAQLTRTLAEQTNNHLVRHRLLILGRLLKDIIKQYADGDKKRIGRMTIEVNRDLREMSGKTAKEKAQDLGLRLANFKSVVKKLEEAFEGKQIRITPGLIRKARIAEDMGWACPYTGELYDAFDLLHKKVDLDHIIPQADRPSNSLDSLVVTFPEVNRMKGKRTALAFMKEAETKQVEGLPRLSLKSLNHFKTDIEALRPGSDPRRAKRRGAVTGPIDDDLRRWKRKELLLKVEKWDGGDFLPADLTVTSQLVRLGAQTLKREFMDLEEPPVTISLPGAVTGEVRKAWNVLGCLSNACPQVLDADGKVKTKTEIRGITHLHHALDACVLGLAAHFIPNNGRVWELIIKRKLTPTEQNELVALKVFAPDSHGNVQLNDLKPARKEQIRQRLAEKRVVLHVPKRMSGLRVEQNTWRVVGEKDGEIVIRQRIRQADGTRPKKETSERPGKLLGLNPTGPSDLQRRQGVLVIPDNFGVALDPSPVILPFHKVWPRLDELRGKNGGKWPRVLRNGQIISVPKGRYQGLWRVFSTKATLKVDLGKPDDIDVEYAEIDANTGKKTRHTTPGCKREVQLSTLLNDSMTILRTPLTGVACSPEPTKLA